MFKSVMHSLLGVGVFNSDGEMWKWVFNNNVRIQINSLTK